MTLYFEDLAVGQSRTTGPLTVTEAEIIEFAEQFDPQPFHVDREAAAESRFGRIFASGWHTTALSMRLFVDGLLGDVADGPALGVDELRWPAPVFGGDELTLTVTVDAKEDWDEDAGVVRFAHETAKQDGETVLTRTDMVLVAKRDS